MSMLVKESDSKQQHHGRKRYDTNQQNTHNGMSSSTRWKTTETEETGCKPNKTQYERVQHDSSKEDDDDPGKLNASGIWSICSSTSRDDDSQQGEWLCNQCSWLNADPKNPKCAVCGLKREGPPEECVPIKHHGGGLFKINESDERHRSPRRQVHPLTKGEHASFSSTQNKPTVEVPHRRSSAPMITMSTAAESSSVSLNTFLSANRKSSQKSNKKNSEASVDASESSATTAPTSNTRKDTFFRLRRNKKIPEDEETKLPEEHPGISKPPKPLQAPSPQMDDEDEGRQARHRSRRGSGRCASPGSPTPKTRPLPNHDNMSSAPKIPLHSHLPSTSPLPPQHPSLSSLQHASASPSLHSYHSSASPLHPHHLSGREIGIHSNKATTIRPANKDTTYAAPAPVRPMPGVDGVETRMRAMAMLEAATATTSRPRQNVSSRVVIPSPAATGTLPLTKRVRSMSPHVPSSSFDRASASPIGAASVPGDAWHSSRTANDYIQKQSDPHGVSPIQPYRTMSASGSGSGAPADTIHPSSPEESNRRIVASQDHVAVMETPAPPSEDAMMSGIRPPSVYSISSHSTQQIDNTTSSKGGRGPLKSPPLKRRSLLHDLGERGFPGSVKDKTLDEEDRLSQTTAASQDPHPVDTAFPMVKRAGVLSPRTRWVLILSTFACLVLIAVLVFALIFGLPGSDDSAQELLAGSGTTNNNNNSTTSSPSMRPTANPTTKPTKQPTTPANPTLSPSLRSALPYVTGNPTNSPSTPAPSFAKTSVPSSSPSDGPSVWRRLGGSIYGAMPLEEFGASVSMTNSGSVVAVGPGGLADVRAYELIHNFWRPQGDELRLLPYEFGVKHVVMSESGLVLVIVVNRIINAFQFLNRTWENMGSNIVVEEATPNVTVALSHNGHVMAVAGVPDVIQIYRFSNEQEWHPDTEGQLEVPRNATSVSVALSDNGETLALAWSLGSVGSARARVFRILDGEWRGGPELPASRIRSGLDDVFDDFPDEVAPGLPAIEPPDRVSVSLSGDGNHVAFCLHQNCHFYQWQKASWMDLEINQNGDTAIVSRDGKIVAIGLLETNVTTSISSTMVGVFQYVFASRRWCQVGQTIEGIGADKRLGPSMSLSGTRLVLGLSNSSGVEGKNSGVVEIYELDGRIRCSDDLADR